MKRILLALALVLYASVALAAGPQGEIVVATGKGGGTYSQIYKDIQAVNTTHTLKEIPDGDSITNLELLMSNGCNLAFVQMDILYAKKMVENDPEIDAVKTFMTLYPAEIHFIALSNNPYVNNYSDIANKKVGIFGGAKYSMKVLGAKTNVRPMITNEYDNPKALIAALDKGEIDVAVAAGGQPIAWIKALNKNYKFVNFDRFDSVRDIYSRAVLDYSTVSNSGCATPAVQSLIVTLDYKTKKKIDLITSFRKSLFANIDEIRETTGSHKKWRVINPRDKGYWPYYAPAN